MAYLTYQEYQQLYTGENAIDEFAFPSIERRAERYIDRLTLTVDNVKKLKVAFPTEEDDVNAVKDCMVEVMTALDNIDVAENANTASIRSGRGGIIASASSGSESVTYATTGSDLIGAAMDVTQKDAYLYKIIKNCLAGAQDANGVNLLYGGRYPCIVTQ